jgi:hypothetical protein
MGAQYDVMALVTLNRVRVDDGPALVVFIRGKGFPVLSDGAFNFPQLRFWCAGFARARCLICRCLALTCRTALRIRAA